MALPAQAQAAADATGARRSARRRASPATAREPLRGGRTLPPISRLVASDMSAERLDRLLPVIVGATATLIAIAVMGSWPVGAYQDDAMYVVLAKALASGEGYRYLNLPGHPAATHFPPGYPAFLAALWTLAPRFPGNMALFTVGFFAAVVLANRYGIVLRDLKLAVAYGLCGAFTLVSTLAFVKARLRL